jgi:hypothetical protein
MKKSIFISLFVFLLSQQIFAQSDTAYLNNQFSKGDILISTDASLNPDSLKLSQKPYDELIIGVYREVTLNKNFDPKRVKIRVNPISNKGTTYVKFNSENGKIMQGDPITSSSEKGIGMKATKSGLIIGVALEDAQGEIGLIKIRILVQLYNP